MFTTVLDAAAGPAGSLVGALTDLLQPLPADLAAAAAIVCLTVAIRLGLVPLSLLRARIGYRQRRLGEQIARIRTQYARQPGQLRLELAEPLRQQRRGTLLGLLPMLGQLPFFVALFRVFTTPTIAGHANGLFAQTLFGTPLGHQWLTNIGSLGLLHPYSPVFAGLFVLLGLVAFCASRLAEREAALTGSTALATPATGSVDLAAPMLKLARVLPYATVVAAAFVPLAAGLYLLTTTAWSAAERWVEQAVRRRSALAT